jgi:predicted nucleic acid-binding protein
MRFADTSFWIALQFARDQHHDAARQLWQDRHTGLVTTNHVLGETWTFLNRRLGHPSAKAFVEGARRSPRLSIEHVSEEAEAEAWTWLRRHDERTYSFVDATSFALMRRLRLVEALAFDGDFAAAGFIELRP